MPNPDWRTMFTIQTIPSVMYLLLILFYLPESPKWLVTRGRVDESIKVLQSLRMMEDVEGTGIVVNKL
jgi:predicted MFS family arabinose efflux permease